MVPSYDPCPNHHSPTPSNHDTPTPTSLPLPQPRLLHRLHLSRGKPSGIFQRNHVHRQLRNQWELLWRMQSYRPPDPSQPHLLLLHAQQLLQTRVHRRLRQQAPAGVRGHDAPVLRQLSGRLAHALWQNVQKTRSYGVWTQSDEQVLRHALRARYW